MKGTIVPIKPEVVVKVIECGPLRIGGHVRIMFSMMGVWLLNNGRLSAVVENRRINLFATVPMSKIKGVPKD